jgi:oxygen-independent coproporphyrinogen-3 oxidase
VNVWNGGNYLGLGPGAHSHRNGRRRANRPDLEAYLDSIKAGRFPASETEAGDPIGRLEERILLGLRLREGLTWSTLAGEFGAEVIGRLREQAEPWSERGLLVADDSGVRIADDGLFVSDALVAELIGAL